MFIGDDVSSSYVDISCNTNRHVAGWKDGHYVYDSSSISNVPDLTVTTTQKIYLFARYSQILGLLTKIYSAKMWNKESTVLVRDIVPVLAPDKGEGKTGVVPAMLDKVNNQVYYNAGSGTFSYGQ